MLVVSTGDGTAFVIGPRARPTDMSTLGCSISAVSARNVSDGGQSRLSPPVPTIVCEAANNHHPRLQAPRPREFACIWARNPPSSSVHLPRCSSAVSLGVLALGGRPRLACNSVAHRTAARTDQNTTCIEASSWAECSFAGHAEARGFAFGSMKVSARMPNGQMGACGGEACTCPMPNKRMAPCRKSMPSGQPHEKISAASELARAEGIKSASLESLRLSRARRTWSMRSARRRREDVHGGAGGGFSDPQKR